MSTGPFQQGVLAWIKRLTPLTQEHFVNTAVAVHDSIVHGSPITGAPALPVDTGALRASWQLTFPSPDVALIATGGIPYAIYVEENVNGVTFKNGGPHGVELTRLGFWRLVDDEAKKLKGGG